MCVWVYTLSRYIRMVYTPLTFNKMPNIWTAQRMIINILCTAVFVQITTVHNNYFHFILFVFRFSFSRKRKGSNSHWNTFFCGMCASQIYTYRYRVYTQQLFRFMKQNCVLHNAYTVHSYTRTHPYRSHSEAWMWKNHSEMLNVRTVKEHQ